jgi:two-component sensor histidine kinase
MQLLAKDRHRRFTLEVNSKLIFDAEGKPIGIHSISRDITERKQAEARQLVLIRELQHRTKNLLAVVQSLITSTLARNRDVDVACKILVGRLHALARAQEFVVEGSSGGVPLRQLIEAELEAFSDRTSVEGVPVILGGAFAQNFALVIHELTTNAVKYDSLAGPNGRVDVRWKVRTAVEPSLSFCWRERGGPVVDEPRETGFGSQLIAAALGSRPRVEFTREGLEFSIEIPFSEISRTSK